MNVWVFLAVLLRVELVSCCSRGWRYKCVFLSVGAALLPPSDEVNIAAFDTLFVNHIHSVSLSLALQVCWHPAS